MKIFEITDIIEAFCPLSLACEWDNAGMQLGNADNEVTGVYVTLDVNMYAAIEARKKGCNLIISHHPMFFSPFKSIDMKTYQGQLIEFLIKSDISVYSAHTNMDKADGGINSLLAKKCAIKNTSVLSDEGFGLIGCLKKKYSLNEYAAYVSDALNTTVRVVGNRDKLINIAAVCSGSGTEFSEAAIKKHADVLITGDLKYHTALDCENDGLCIIDAGHYPTEVFVMDIFCRILEKINIKIIKSISKDCFWYVNKKEK